MSSGKYLMSHPGGKKLHHPTPLAEQLTPTLPAGPLGAVPFLNNEENNTAKGGKTTFLVLVFGEKHSSPGPLLGK